MIIFKKCLFALIKVDGDILIIKANEMHCFSKVDGDSLKVDGDILVIKANEMHYFSNLVSTESRW